MNHSEKYAMIEPTKMMLELPDAESDKEDLDKMETYDVDILVKILDGIKAIRTQKVA